MTRMTDAEYKLLNRFVRTVLQRVTEGRVSVDIALEDIMHPLTARDRQNADGFVPWMKDALREWGNSET